jgi:hypothetical protein
VLARENKFLSPKSKNSQIGLGIRLKRADAERSDDLSCDFIVPLEHFFSFIK